MSLQARPDPSFVRFAADSLLAQLHALTKESAGVREAKDPEFVHRMRVASRRLRTRLRLFSVCLPAKKVASWEKQVRRVTRALAAARDTDVQIDFVAGFAENITEPKEKPGIQRLLFRLRQRRQKLQARVEKALDRLEGSGVVAEMEETLRRLRMSVPGPENSPPSPADYALAREEILARFVEMESYEIYIPEPSRAQELHQMRIAAKHFRYAMEVFASWYPDELSGPLKAVRRIQELLGELHDCDVWLSELPRFLEEERKAALEFYGSARGLSRLKPGVTRLAEDRAATREKRYKQFVEFWEKTKAEGTWKQLVDTLSTPLATAETEVGLVAAEESP